MDFALLIPITAFLCTVAIIKIIVDSRLRRRLAETHASEDLVRAMLTADEHNRSLSALKWGIVLTLIGLAFGLIDLLNLDGNDPATFGLLIGSAGLGMLGFHGFTARKH
ncbi:MAG TPA: hypothetical protein DDZ76_15705 [Xanthomonadales bacterium]|nr:hypothetical protein [Xanthomonadales bacterium]